MSLLELNEAQLRDAGSLKWTGIQSSSDIPTKGAWVAEMDFGTSPQISARLKKAIDQGMLGYGPLWLKDAVSETLCHFQEKRFGWSIDTSWVRHAASVLHALEATISQLTRPGSPVVVPTPAYMPFLTIPKKLGREIYSVPSRHTPNLGGNENVTPMQAWSLNLPEIRNALEAGAGLVILCNPWNPTGRSLKVSELRALHDLVSQYDALIFADEIHSPLVFQDQGSFTSYASLGPTFASHTVTAVAASKGWNIAGFPAAQVILPDHKLQDLWDSKASEFASGATAFGMLGAMTAYQGDDEWQLEVLDYLSTNLDLLDEALSGTKIDYTRPQATYLTWWGWGAYQLAAEPSILMRDEALVGVNAGSTLGPDYLNWTRVNAAMPKEQWEQTLESSLKMIGQLNLR